MEVRDRRVISGISISTEVKRIVIKSRANNFFFALPSENFETRIFFPLSCVCEYEKIYFYHKNREMIILYGYICET